jgi:phosphatidate phosphatase PAH1
MHQQLWGYKVEQKLYLWVREQKRLITTDLDGLISKSWVSSVFAFSRTGFVINSKNFANLTVVYKNMYLCADVTCCYTR